jgi:hypothetical protein
MIFSVFNKRRDPWQIAAARYCVENSEKGFTVSELKAFLGSRYNIDAFQINEFFEEEIRQPSGRQFSRIGRTNNQGSGVWTPPISLLTSLTEYDSLEEARRSSRNALRIAIGSLLVSAIVGIAQIWLAVK